MKSRALLAAAVLAATPFAMSLAADTPQPQMSAEEQMMMEKWQAYMTPGEPHARMAKLVGDWDTTTRMWMQPGAPPEESTGGETHFQMIMDGRYLVQHSKGSFMGQPFHGMGLTGYDNMKKVYQATWVDNMGTGIMYSEGTCEGKVCTYHGEAPDVMVGKYKTVKSVTRDVSDDEAVFEMYDRTPDGKEFKSLEIIYRRKK